MLHAPRFPRMLGLAGAVALMTISAQTPAPPTPTAPQAPVKDHREIRHGETVVDPYYWLREKSNPEVIHYLEAENAYTEAITKDLKPFQDALYTEMLARIKQTDLSVPVRRSGYLYYTRSVAAHDAADRAPDSLADYYTARGESPGMWMGTGLAAFENIHAGDTVTVTISHPDPASRAKAFRNLGDALHYQAKKGSLQSR